MTTTSPKDPERRFWIAATAVTGGTGLTATAVPFVTSIAPSERARAIGAPFSFDLQGMKEGEPKTVEWRGQPVFALRRSPAMLEALQKHDDLLTDPRTKRSEQPSYAKNANRSVWPEINVMVGLCTHLGCTPTFKPTPGAADTSANWIGGFYCPGHGSKFDLAGRVFKNLPAPTTLVISLHHFASDASLLIGVDLKA
jgi:ubiquinol-cytochrome c reductase iron-sulfur subunit